MTELPKRIWVIPNNKGSDHVEFVAERKPTWTVETEYAPASELEEAKKLLREARQYLNPALSTSEEIDAFLEGK